MTGTDIVERRTRWRDAAHGIANDLVDEAVWSDGMCAFHGATAPDSIDHPPRCRSMGGDIYEGSAGIARFLSLAAATAQDTRLRDTALGAVRHALDISDGWSLFAGGVGIGLSTLEVARDLDEPGLVSHGIRLIESSSEEALDGSAPSDLLAGSAGVVLGLVAARPYDLDGGWTARAFDLGRRLLATAIEDGVAGPDGPPLSWALTPGSPVRLCGLAHGASGVALAFDALATLAPDAHGWRSAARRARTYERAHYSTAEGSWADLRPPDPGQPSTPPYPHMWCHGSIGVTAERLVAVDHDLLARADAVGGLAGARRYAERLVAGPAGPGGSPALNGSLCHGLAGMIDLFVDAWCVTGDQVWLDLAGDLGDLALNDARRAASWRSGVPGGWPAPGLMLGSAGIGYVFLRLADPAVVPSCWRPRSL